MKNVATKNNLIIALIFAVVLLCVLMVIIASRTIAVMNNLNATLAEIDTLVSDAKTTLSEILAIDLKTLNQAVQDFAKVVKPLADLFGR